MPFLGRSSSCNSPRASPAGRAIHALKKSALVLPTLNSCLLASTQRALHRPCDFSVLGLYVFRRAYKFFLTHVQHLPEMERACPGEIVVSVFCLPPLRACKMDTRKRRSLDNNSLADTVLRKTSSFQRLVIPLPSAVSTLSHPCNSPPS